MTVKQKKFADEYIVSGNATQAAIKAGYSKKYVNTNASKLLQNTTIKTYIDQRLKEIEKDKIATADEVMQKLTSILRQELTEEKIEVSPITGEFLTINKKPSIAEVIKAGTEIMKRYPLDANEGATFVINYKGIPNDED
ncbi:terminase small subunit [Facklamia sp. P13064]|uniref:terminase small subunit n=1 Tax=Facklamia sp. P13064 TaxID=3421953 RepID=UPI003D173AC0